MENTVVWKPKQIEKSQMYAFLKFVNQQYQQNISTYHQLQKWSTEHLANFWQAVAQFYKVIFDATPSHILQEKAEIFHAQWFSGTTLNYTKNLLKRRDNHTALISIDEQNNRKTMTYAELWQAVSACAAGLKSLGVEPGDRVAAILPNVSFTVIAFLATAAVGAIWSSCSTDFGLDAALERLGQIEPKILFISDGHQYNGKLHQDTEKGEKFSQQITSINKVVICPILNLPLTIFSKAMLWDELLKSAGSTPLSSFSFNHPLYILFSSGTTGKPKCIIHRTGGVLLQHLKELGLHTDISDRDNLFFYTTCGWMMWNWMVSVLALGATLTLYEGSPTFPEVGKLFQIIEQEKVSVFGTSAKFISLIEKEQLQPREQYNLENLRCILSTGSPLLPKNYDFVYEQIKEDIQLCSISGGTDIVSCFALGNPLLPIYKGELQCLGLGMAVAIYDESGKPVSEIMGDLVCTKPFPSMPLGFWNDPNNEKYYQAYFSKYSGVWAHGDYAEITSRQGLVIFGRSDAVLNPGGVRIGTAEIYHQIEKIPEILDSVAIGQVWQDDVRIILFIKLRPSVALTDELVNAIKKTIRNHASPRHVPAKILQVNDIPKTISGKTVELAVREVVHGRAVKNLSSIANPESLKYFENRQELSS
jgi:acetoacetyl-CoA synthetase